MHAAPQLACTPCDGIRLCAHERVRVRVVVRVVVRGTRADRANKRRARLVMAMRALNRLCTTTT